MTKIEASINDTMCKLMSFIDDLGNESQTVAPYNKQGHAGKANEMARVVFALDRNDNSFI